MSRTWAGCRKEIYMLPMFQSDWRDRAVNSDHSEFGSPTVEQNTGAVGAQRESDGPTVGVQDGSGAQGGAQGLVGLRGGYHEGPQCLQLRFTHAHLPAFRNCWFKPNLKVIALYSH